MRLSRPSAEEQKELMQGPLLKSVQAGETWYLISRKWLEDWEQYIRNATSNAISNASSSAASTDATEEEGPGPIDNSSLVDTEDSLLATVEEGRDYDFVPEEAWTLLHQWYSGGPALPRKAIRLNNRSQCVVEARPTTITIISKEAGTVTVRASKADTIGELKKLICDQWNLNASEIEVWDGEAKTKIRDADKQLGELNIFEGQKIFVNDKKMKVGGKEEEDDDDDDDDDDDAHEISNSPPISSRASYSPYTSSYSSYPYSSYSSYSSYDSAKKHRPSPAGLVGLNNLGNTCFMNSSLQCLSNTVPLAEFFLSNSYVRDINTENPLGMKGKLAEEFSRLIKEMWNGQHNSVAPRDFKGRLEQFAPQFSGYQQHDSQELLAFLLDGLHEDLNRVKNKLYGSVKEGDDIPDEERVAESWAIHKGRNDSVIVDWFQALLKSTLVCPTCNRVSITFDPFMYLSLPLPAKVDRSIPLVFFPRDVEKPPTKYLVKVPKAGNMVALKRALGEMAGVSGDGIIITDFFNCKFFKKFTDNDNLDAIDEDRDVIYAYEALPQSEDGPQIANIAVYHRKEEKYSYSYSNLPPSTQLFGTPFFVSVPSPVTYGELYSHVLQAITRWLKPGAISTSIGEAHQSETAEKASQEKDTEQDDSSDKGSEDEVKTANPPDRLFTIVSVDSHGYHEQVLPDNNEPLDLNNGHTIAIHWQKDKLALLDETKFKEFHVHSSVRSAMDPHASDAITLDKCLQLYTTTERLGPDDPWYCNKCKEFQQATKKFDLWNCPRILVIHLKRFSYRNKYSREKLETLVSYPLRDLDLSPHIIGPATPAPIYDLYAVSNHYGGLGGGHYTAYALNKSTNKWYKFDDSSVSEVDESQVVSSSAYVLFYRRRDTLSMSSAVPSATTSSGSSVRDDNYYDSHINHSNGGNGTTSSHHGSSHMDLD